MQDKWIQRFLNLAEHISSWSKDPSTKVGAVIVDPLTKHVIGVGYNGFPATVQDESDLLNDREEKYSLTVHAEVNAVLNCDRPVKECWIFVTHPPCPDCAKFIAAAGIRTVVYRSGSEDFTSRWEERINKSLEIFKRAFIQVLPR